MLFRSPTDLRDDPDALDLSPLSRGYAAGPRREIRVTPPPAPAPGGLDPRSLLDPLGWRALIGIACLVRLVTEAEIAAELGVTRLRRCVSPKCGAWFLEERPGGGRPRTHCSPTCRVTALRARTPGPAAPKPQRKKIAKE